MSHLEVALLFPSLTVTRLLVSVTLTQIYLAQLQYVANTSQIMNPNSKTWQIPRKRIDPKSKTLQIPCKSTIDGLKCCKYHEKRYTHTPKRCKNDANGRLNLQKHCKYRANERSEFQNVANTMQMIDPNSKTLQITGSTSPRRKTGKKSKKKQEKIPKKNCSPFFLWQPILAAGFLSHGGTPSDHSVGISLSINAGFQKCGYPIAGRFIREDPIKMDDLGVPLL